MLQKRKRTTYTPHPNDKRILDRITDIVEYTKVAKRLRKRRKKLCRDCDFGGQRLIRAKTLVDKSRGRRSLSRKNYTNNNVRSLRRTGKAPGPAMVPFKAPGPAMIPFKGSVAKKNGATKEGDHTDSDFEDETRERIKLIAQLKKKELRHRQAAGRDYACFTDKRDDPDRLTWDEFTTLYHHKMDHAQQSDMINYRKKLDRERASKLAARSRLNKKNRRKHKKRRKKKCLQ